MYPLEVFHRKCLKSFLKLSKTAPTPSIHFLLGDLPMEGKIHRDIFGLFYSVWTNPDTKIFSIIKYLLETLCENSCTWAIYLRQISAMYGLEDPLDCLMRDPPPIETYKEHILTKITSFHERELREKALNEEKNEINKMKYFNVSLLGLRGRLHPSMSLNQRVTISHAVLPALFQLSRDFCYIIDKKRMRVLNPMVT